MHRASFVSADASPIADEEGIVVQTKFSTGQNGDLNVASPSRTKKLISAQDMSLKVTKSEDPEKLMAL